MARWRHETGEQERTFFSPELMQQITDGCLGVVGIAVVCLDLGRGA